MTAIPSLVTKAVTASLPLLRRLLGRLLGFLCH